MIIKYIFKVIPIPVFYSNRFFKNENITGRSYGVFIIIRPHHRDDKVLLEHELIHCKQFYRTLGIHGIAYNVNKKYRLYAELEAYKTRYDIYENKMSAIYNITNSIYSYYNLKMSKDEVLDVVRKYY